MTAADTRDPRIEVRALQHWFGDGDSRRQALYDNHIRVMPGEIVIMTGPSGSGKTTLLTLLGGLRAVQEGEVTVLGRKIHGMTRDRLVELRRDIGFIFQFHNLFDALTSFQNVCLALGMHQLPMAEKKQRAEDILTRLGLKDRMHHTPAKLSGGQRQRVAIARALVNHPKLILADEPTAALDKESGRQVVSILQERAEQEGTAVLLVTHDNRILDVAHRIVNMLDGRIVSDVSADESIAIGEFLRKSPALAGSSATEIAAVARKMSIETQPAGTVLYRKGDATADKFYIVRQGKVRQSELEGAADRTLCEGDFFGENALLAGGNRRTTAVVQEDAELYVLFKADFQAAIEAVPSFHEQLRKALFQPHA